MGKIKAEMSVIYLLTTSSLASLASLTTFKFQTLYVPASEILLATFTAIITHSSLQHYPESF